MASPGEAGAAAAVMAMARGPEQAVCHNCGARLAGPFCSACGQKAQPLNLSLHDLLHDVVHEVLHVDGRIVRSIRKLLLSPGFLTREYIQGRRAAWVPPLRLYLIFSLIYFGVAHAGGGKVTVTGPDQETRAELQRLGFQNEAELQETVGHAQATWVPRVMFVLVPLFAWLVHVVYRRDGWNYPQHLYFALHVHAALFAAGAVAGLAVLAGDMIGRAGKVLAVLYGLTYLVLAFRTAYGGTIRRAALRAAIVGSIYFAVTIASVLAIILPAVFRHR